MALTQQHIEQIRQCTLFAPLSDAELKQVASHGHLVELNAGQIIFSQGESCHQFYLVQRGMIKLYRLSVDGTEKVMDLAAPKQLFAEAVMFTGKYPLHAAAIEPSTVFAFDCMNFIALLKNNNELCFILMSSMSHCLNGMINEIDRLTLHSGTQRLAEYLLEQVPEGVMQSSCIRLLVPKLVIASRLGIQPETFSRIMARLRSDGMIETHNDTILLKDLDALRCLAACHG
ncbi:Crp/Fnr family transcriptional regulator [Sulfuricella sp. T08]|uniref:Crp/Fnr family transcriptional regulator n=1 Tax=Sulfuricella sp. T08 TaxID=1632857 RepID=UPI0006179D00|nr:Crp/Fnr family transcriptional regulator [Sulfuricella sp. T08]GAO36874.1 Crp/Fnr family transcriptional regulator [Sulfuricella sp. T08]